jgi:hypothetical protein
MTQRTTVRRAVRTLEAGELLPALRGPEPSDNIIYVNARPAPVEDDAAGFVVERRTPTRTPDLRADVLVPFWQTVITGLVAFVVMGLLAWACAWSWRVPVVITALIVGYTWWARLRLVDALLWRIESASGRDVNRDGRIGKPLRGPVLVNPHAARERVQRLHTARASEEQRHDLLVFAARCHTVGTSESAHGVKASGPDRRRYVERRDALFALGLARWKVAGRPNAGWELAIDAETTARTIQEHVL